EPAETAAVHRATARHGFVYLRSAQPLRRGPVDRRHEAHRVPRESGHRLPDAGQTRGRRSVAASGRGAPDLLRARLRLPATRALVLPTVPAVDRISEPGH